MLPGAVTTSRWGASTPPPSMSVLVASRWMPCAPWWTRRTRITSSLGTLAELMYIYGYRRSLLLHSPVATALPLLLSSPSHPPAKDAVSQPSSTDSGIATSTRSTQGFLRAITSSTLALQWWPPRRPEPRWNPAALLHPILGPIHLDNAIHNVESPPPAMTEPDQPWPGHSCIRRVAAMPTVMTCTRLASSPLLLHPPHDNATLLQHRDTTPR